MGKETFKSYLKYDYSKYLSKLDELNREIEINLSKTILATSPDAVTSSTWHNGHNEESYSDAKERLALGRAKQIQNNKIGMLESWMKNGIFHRRLTFQNGTNFYVTTASVDADYSFNGDFLVSYWGIDSYRAEALMQFDVGDESPANGELLIAGDFTPNKRDLINIRYKDTTGKFEFISAENVIDSIEKVVEEDANNLINTDEFFRLKFNLAGLGDQSRALYDTNSAIIDGAAGTGKSTIALQKLKYLYEKKNITQEKMLVIVKNEQVIPHFKTLLESETLSLYNVNIYTVSSLFDILEIDSNINIDDLEDAKNTANKLTREIKNSINQINLENMQKHFDLLIEYIGKDIFTNSLVSMIEEIKNDKEKTLQINIINEEIKEISQSLLTDEIDDNEKLELIDLLKNKTNKVKQLNGENYKKALSTIEESLEKISSTILHDIVEYNYGSDDLLYLKVLEWIKKYINYFVNKDKVEKQLLDIITEIDTLNTLEEDTQTLEDIQEELNILKDEVVLNPESSSLKKDLKELQVKYKKQIKTVRNHELLPKRQVELEERLIKKFDIDKADKKGYESVLNSIYLTKSYIEKTYLHDISKTDSYLVLLYTLNDSQEFDTIIVDEAQDYTLVELELLRFQTKRIIFTGDILQNIQPNKMKSWQNILNVNDVYSVENEAGDSSLNIFNLKHNFRQTYQLANASYNFRQLLLNGGLEDIEKEYYLSEKEFNGKAYNLPMVKHISKSSHFVQYVEEKIEHITKTYSSKIPITVLYKTNIEKEEYFSIFNHLRISEDINDIDNLDILLVNILHAKGKEYPLVLSNLDNLSDNEIYLIMTRAQFELDFVTKYTVCSNRHLQTLIDKKWINKKDVLDFQNTPEGISEISSQDQNNSVSTEQIPTTISAGATIDGIVKHTGSVEQIEDEIQPSIIIDEQRYKDDFLKQLNLQQSLPRKKEVVFIKKDIDKDTTRLNNEIKIFLYNTYKGYCQSCGFTFRKLKDSQNSFEKFNWNDKRIVKVKKRFCIISRFNLFM